MTYPTKAIYFGSDFFSGCLATLLDHRVDVAALYVGDSPRYSVAIEEIATRKGIPVIRGRPLAVAMEEWVARGVDLFFSAAFGFRIPIPRSLRYSLNVHPTALPRGRGPAPISWLIRAHPEDAALSIHKLSDVLDSGAIVAQRMMSVDPNDTLDTFAAKLFVLAPMTLAEVLGDFEASWSSARPQTGVASYFPEPSNADRLIDTTAALEDINRVIRAFGSMGCLFKIGSRYIEATGASTCVLDHCHSVGSVVQDDAFRLSIALRGGLLIFPRDTICESQAIEME